MAEESLQFVTLREEFYRDSLGKLVAIIISIIVAIILVIGISLYLFLDKPKPIIFRVSEDFRVIPPVALDQEYLSKPDLFQWVANVLPKLFTYDFINYNDQLKDNAQYFTPAGWEIFLTQLNNYAQNNDIQTNKLFTNAMPANAPSLYNRGIVSGRFTWQIIIPISITYAGTNPPPNKTVTFQLSVVRVPTLNNLDGVAIDNMVVMNSTNTV
jgi:intracellular multiplication protein IcmL